MKFVQHMKDCSRRRGLVSRSHRVKRNENIFGFFLIGVRSIVVYLKVRTNANVVTVKMVKKKKLYDASRNLLS